MRKILPLDIMRYYVTYKDIEQEIIENINSKNIEIRKLAYEKYVHKHMGIGRNFKAGTFAMILVTVTNMLREGIADVEELSNRYVRSELLSKSNIKKVEVAASKLLWLYRNETIIMDSINMKKLKAKDYKSYVENWKKEFEVREQEIIEVSNKYFSDIDELITERWFRMRVFDQYLQTI